MCIAYWTKEISSGFEQPWSVCGIWGNRLWRSLAQSSQVGNMTKPWPCSCLYLNSTFNIHLPSRFEDELWWVDGTMNAKQCIANQLKPFKIAFYHGLLSYWLLSCAVTLFLHCTIGYCYNTGFAMWQNITKIKTGHCSCWTFILKPIWSFTLQLLFSLGHLLLCETLSLKY